MNLEPNPPRMRLLLVDSSHEFFARVILLLDEIAPRRFVLEWASTYGFAVTLLRRSQFAVCLSSSRIGHRSGADLIRAMRSMDCHTPVLLLGSSEELTEHPAAHAYDYLDRNRLSASMLHQAIREAAARRPVDLRSPPQPLLVTGFRTRAAG